MNPLRTKLLPFAFGLVLATSAHGEETWHPVGGTLGSSTLSVYVDTSASFGSGAVVPEPGVLALAALGTAVLLFASRRFRRRE